MCLLRLSGFSKIPLLTYTPWPLSQVGIKRCAAHFLSHPTCPLDLLTCHSQVHLVAFRPPNHPHFNLCQPLRSRFRASEREAFCVRALDVMQGKWRIVLLRLPAGCSRGKGRRPCGNGCLEEVSAGCYVSQPTPPPWSPRAEGLLIKPKLDTGSNYCIAPRLALIQGLVLSVCLRAVQPLSDRNGQLCIVCNVSHCDYCFGGSRELTQHPQSIVIKGQ